MFNLDDEPKTDTTTAETQAATPAPETPAADTTPTSEKKTKGRKKKLAEVAAEIGVDLNKIPVSLVDPDDLVIVGLDTDAKDRKDNILYDERIHLPLEDEKVASMDQTNGVVPTLFVQEGTKEVIFGRQRTRYGREANKIREKEGRARLKLPVIYLPVTDRKTLLHLSIQENTARTPDTLLGEGYKFKFWIEENHEGEWNEAVYKAVGERFGVSPSTVESRLKLTKLAPSVQSGVASGAIGFVEATQKLAKLSQEEQESVGKERVKRQKERRAKGESDSKPKVKKKDKIKKAILAFVKEHDKLPATVKLMLWWAAGEKDTTDDQVMEALGIPIPQPKAKKEKPAKKGKTKKPAKK